MKPADNPNWFAHSPLKRVNSEYSQDDFIEEKLVDPSSQLVPLWRGDPLVADGAAAFLSAAARSEFGARAPVVLLGVKDGVTFFGIDASAALTPEVAPFADIGVYTPIREAAAQVPRDDLAVIGHARWLFEWHRGHPHCAKCGEATKMVNGGAKRICPSCEAEHFPRTDPVAIVLAVHEDACLLGRGPQFPEGMLSALAGFIEASETPEEAAKRELFEEAGVTLTDIRYQFSQPWPFPNSMMMGFIADTEDRTLNLDTNEIVEARWIDRANIVAALAGDPSDFFIPPKFTIARQLLERWSKG
ncbi:MAG: NAD(+) diphosphatase [Marinicaulis sp.]|nr:NAD(+) diphosphatase [Marinicaulis sp.]NNE40644.1 NAD(+) diphosphatase [Marinicaulis sp.]NNL90472.1 NAD(+) diphosphatase [Marinicaulis sp.]